VSDDLRSWDAWRSVHQPFELDWQRNAVASGHYDSVVVVQEWQAIREFIDARGAILDIGCGPKPMFFPSTVIDPLVDEYRKFTPREWWDGILAYAQPAENHIDGKFDTIVCWNTLDHTIGWREILVNIASYAQPWSRIAIATDFHPPFPGHPGFERWEFQEEIDRMFEVIDRREPLGRQLALKLRKKTEIDVL